MILYLELEFVMVLLCLMYLADGSYGHYEWLSYAEVEQMAIYAARGMIKLNLPAEQEYEGKPLKTIAIFSKNRLEWVLTDIGCWMSSTVAVPLYETLGEEAIEYIVEQCQFTTLYVSVEAIPRALELKRKGKFPLVKNLVCYDEVTPEMKAKSELNIISFQDLIELGKKETTMELRESKPDEIFTICYTSGTTGLPKGAIIKHGDVRKGASTFVYTGVFTSNRPGITFISYLPLAHMYERVMVCLVIIAGFKEGFYHGVVGELKDDIAECKPNFFSGVPRILTRFYDVIMKNFNSMTGFKKALVDRAIKAKLAHLKATGDVTHWLYDKLIFNKIRESFGGQIELILTGSAPLDANIMDRLKIFLSAYTIHGYAQTETSGAVSVASYYDIDTTHVGPPMLRYSAKLVDVPEMQYYSTDVINGVPTPRGELYVKGPVTPGYFKLPDKTEEAIDPEGWLKTGDIAQFTPNGCIKIIDRKKNIFKLQQGEYVAPEKIENILSISPWIQQIMVYGNSYESYILAIIVPSESYVMQWARKNGIKGSFEDLCASQELNKTILKNITDISREKKLVGFEIIKKIHLMAEPFTMESGLMTPTLKIKRIAANKRFEKVFNDLYAQPMPVISKP